MQTRHQPGATRLRSSRPFHRTLIGTLTLTGFIAPCLLLAQETGTPLSLEEVNLTHAVPDTVIYHDPANPPNLNNWEPYVGVLGISTFLVGVNTFAEGTTDQQRFAFVAQPAAGGPNVLGDHFFGDDGTVYRGPINASRQDGNPQRIAGDPRPGAVNIITGAEASPHLTGPFLGDDRWNLGYDRLGNGRYGTVQTFSMDLSTLSQTPLSKAFDAITGRVVEGTAASNQSTRFGGDLVGLDNGNFVVMVEDRSRVINPAADASVFVVVAPDGSIVTESTQVAAGGIWSNLAAYQGGFCVRANGVLYFYDNYGTLKGQIAGADSGIAFDAGRGDGTRIGGHINGPYVYLAGAADKTDDEGNKIPGIYLAIFDSRDHSYVASYKVDNYPGARDRTVVTADALGRIVVAWASRPEGYAGNQIVARVLKFDACSNEITPITEPFFTFLNHGPEGFSTVTPSIASTTKQILVAAKGNVNLLNDISAGPDSPAQTTVYAVINHPEPEEDPTTPATSTLPASVAEAGLSHIVPDKTIFNGPEAPPNLNNWEPYVGVLGNSTFLVGANTFAEESTSLQRFAFVMQPVTGGAATEGDHFFGDDGTPYRGGINESRQDGNPQRIAGDPRPGAVNIITGAEASPHLRDPFKSDDRWDLGFDRLVNGRYGTVQTFAIDPQSLSQTMLSKAFDAANGRETQGAAGNSQTTRFGGDLVGLDNGNFVVSVEDRSQVRGAANQSVFVIVAPDGSIVKETTVVVAADLWANLAAFKGGFAIRAAGIIHFYNNAGDLQGSIDGRASGVAFDPGRGDGTRLAGHINSPYIYLAGAAGLITPAGNVDSGVRLAVFDSRDQSFVTHSRVDDRNGVIDRVVVGADALNRIVVAYGNRPPDFAGLQIVARVLRFDDCSETLSPLTPNFFAFINHRATDFITSNPSVAMTTRQILIAGKGRINLANDPEGEANSNAQTTLYTVISHPDPKDDPTTPVSTGSIRLSSAVPVANGKATLSWTGGTAPYTVQTKSTISAGWTDVQTGVAATTLAVDVGAGQAYFRVIGQ